MKCTFWIAIGGKGSEPGDGVQIKFSVNTVAGQLDKLRTGTDWRASFIEEMPAPVPDEPRVGSMLALW